MWVGDVDLLAGRIHLHVEWPHHLQQLELLLLPRRLLHVLLLHVLLLLNLLPLLQLGRLMVEVTNNLVYLRLVDLARPGYVGLQPGRT